jgi:DNA-binding HxlR family transcriptional regulator
MTIGAIGASILRAVDELGPSTSTEVRTAITSLSNSPAGRTMSNLARCGYLRQLKAANERNKTRYALTDKAREWLAAPADLRASRKVAQPRPPKPSPVVVRPANLVAAPTFRPQGLYVPPKWETRANNIPSLQGGRRVWPDGARA